MNLLFLTTPAFIFFALFFSNRRDPSRRAQAAPACVAGLALLSLVVLLNMMAHPGPWRERTQIAWVGVEAADQKPLAMGSDLTEAVPGWPHNFTTPRILFAAQANGTVKLDSSGGGGFVLDGKDDVLYGAKINDETPVAPPRSPDYYSEVRPYKLTVKKECWLPLPLIAAPLKFHFPVINLFWLSRIDLNKWHISISDENGRSLLLPDEGSITASQMTVLSLSGQLDKTVRRLRDSSDPASGPLTQWASHIYILLHTDGKAYYVADWEGDETTQSAALPRGSIVSVLWPRQKLRARVELHTGSVRLVFQPPFRHSSPLPPEEFGEESKLNIEASPLPGDKAFLLPVSLLTNKSYDATLTHGSFETPVTAPSGLAINLHDDAPVESYADFPGVTSSLDATIDRYHFYIDTIRDVPAAWFGGPGLPMSVILIWIWFGYAGCIALLTRLSATSLEQRSRLALLGLSFVVWIILCLRVGLAFRYAVNPGTVDDLAYRGMLLSLNALAAVPGLLLVFAYLVAVEPNEAARQRKIWWLPLFNLFVLLALPFLLAHVWPILHPSSFQDGWSVGGPFYFLWIALYVLLVRKLRRLRKTPWRNAPSDEGIFLRERFSGLQKWATSRWENGWPWKNLFFGLGICAVLCLCAGATDLLPWTSLNGIGKEAFAPLCQLLALAVLLSAGPYSMRSKKHIPFMRAFLLSAILIVVPFIALPVCFGDIGGIYGGFSLLIPFIFVLLFRVFKRTGKLLLPLALVCAFLAGVFYLFPQWAPGDRSQVRIEIARHGEQWIQNYMIWESAYNAKKGGTSPAQQLADADAHIWANRRMVENGKFVGAGFGNARPQKAGIPLQTLQSDSTYAFYIASEHGALGGVCLLLLAALPLAFAFWRHKQGSDPTWLSDLLYIISASFFVETLCQVAMNNLPFIPLTGRSMPLLAVHSCSDVLRWTVLFACAALLMVSERQSSAKKATELHTWHSIVAICLVLGGVALPVFALASDVQPIYDRDKPMRDQVEDLQKEPKQLLYDASSGRIRFRNPVTNEVKDSQMQQEIARFNDLPDAQKISSEVRSDKGMLNNVTTQQEYDASMQQAMLRDPAPQSPVHPPIFRVSAPGKYADADDITLNTDTEYEIDPNPAFDSVVDLDTALKPDDVKTLTWRDGSGDGWVLQGMGARVRIESAAKDAPGAASASVVLDKDGGHFTSTADVTSGKTVFSLDCTATHDHKARGRRGKGHDPLRPVLMDVDARVDGVTITAPDLNLEYQGSDDGTYKDLDGSIHVTGDTRMRTRAGVCGLPDNPVFTITHSVAGALVGHAWVEGEWVSAYDKTAGITWLQQLAYAMHSAKAPEFDRLTLDRELQIAAQSFVESKGIALQKNLINFLRASRVGARWMPATTKECRDCSHDNIPPRIALSIMSAPSGEVLALGGWPRSSTSDVWETAAHPPARWLMTKAPAEIRSRYLGDRNFDLETVGSASKPIWAAAALTVNPRLINLKVRNLEARKGSPAGVKEHSLFGVSIPQKEWTGSESGSWIAFTANRKGCLKCPGYLAQSDNGYQIRLNFLALAQPNSGSNVVDVEHDEQGHEKHSGSQSETFGTQPWDRIPDLQAYGFGSMSPGTLYGLQSSTLASAMQAYFPLEVSEGTLRRHTISFWSGDELDDRALARGTTQKEDPWDPYVYISPATTDLKLNEFTTPRDFITALLGDGTNMWSNVNLPSGIYTALFGKPLVPHIGMLENPANDTREKLSDTVTGPIQEGLADMVTGGTGKNFFADPKNRLTLISSLGEGYSFYGKTGTLGADDGLPDMARVILVIVPKDNPAGRPRKTLVLSLYIEHGGKELNFISNNAVKGLAEFISQNKDLIKSAMQ